MKKFFNDKEHAMTDDVYGWAKRFEDRMDGLETAIHQTLSRVKLTEELMKNIMKMKPADVHKNGEVILDRRRSVQDRRTEKSRDFRKICWTGASMGTGVSCRRGSYDNKNEDVDF